MPKLIEQNGARVKTGWPVQIHRYEPGKLPDPADVLDCLLIVNDRSDGIPRARLVLSNGASYDTVAYLTDIPAGSPAADLAPELPALTLPPPLPAPVPTALVVAEVSRQIATLQPVSDASRVAALEHRVAEQDHRLAECERIIDEFIAAAKASQQIKLKDRY